jgi:WAS/WASL-interacting protein
MASRVGGVLALVAAACLTAALVLPWWRGHPSVEGHERTVQDVTITLFGGEGCNSGGDGSCTKVPLVGGFKTLEAVEVGVAAGALLVAAGVGAAALLRSRRRMLAGRLGMIAGGAAALITLVLLITGPDIHTQMAVSVPTALGGFVALLGAITAVAGSALARRDDPVRPPAPMRVVTPAPMAMQQPLPLPQPAPPVAEPPAPGLDVQALLADDALRPARLGPEARRTGAMPPSTSGNLPGPAGPLVPPQSAPPPLFSSAPQLRPLYEMPGAGYVPPPPPALPTRAPTPIARSMLEQEDSSVPPPPPPRSAPRRTGPPAPTRPPTTLGPNVPAMPPPRPARPTGLGASGQPAPVGAASPPPPSPPPSPPAAPSRVAQPIIMSPRGPGPGSVPTPPPLGLPTPPLSGSTPALSRADLLAVDDDDEPSQEPSQEPSENSFDGRSTVARDPDPPPTDPDAGSEQTSPGMSVALEETPAAELLSPDDIETRGLRKLQPRELEEMASRDSLNAMTTPLPVFKDRIDRPTEPKRPSDPIMTSATRPPPVATPTPTPRVDTDADPVLDDDEPEPTGEHTDDRAPVPGALSSPPRIPTPPSAPPVALDVGHAPTPVAPTPLVVPTPPVVPTVAQPAPVPVLPVPPLPTVPPLAAAVAALPPSPPQPPPPRAIKTPLPSSGPQPACPQCDAPMVWVEEHLRFYCRSCKMYF